MNKQQLVDAARHHLRHSIACTLNISIEDYRKSLDAQTATNRCLTNVMSLGYNESFAEALREACEYRFAGGGPSSEEFDDFVDELKGCNNTFAYEIFAYKEIFRKFDGGIDPTVILRDLESDAPLTPEYRKASIDSKPSNS